MLRDLRARLLHVDLHPVRLRHGRDVRRGDHRREPPGAARRPVVGRSSRARRGRSSCSRSSCRSRTSRPRWPPAWPASSRSRRRSQTNLNGELIGGITRRRALPLRHPRVGLRVHAGHPGRRDPDDVLDGPRRAPARSAGRGATSATRFRTPGQRRDRGRRPRRHPDPARRSDRRHHARRSPRPG